MILFKSKTLKNKKGQSVVEYILLFGVIATLAFSVFKMDALRDLLGSDSEFLKSIRERLEYSYRHGSMKNGKVGNDSSDYSGKHESYYNKQKGVTHFFGPVSAYPDN
jgi:hypothetical protein